MAQSTDHAKATARPALPALPALPTTATSHRYYIDMCSRYIKGTLTDMSGAPYPAPPPNVKFLIPQYIQFWTGRMKDFLPNPAQSGLPFMEHDRKWPTFPDTALRFVQAICLSWYKQSLQEYRQKEAALEGATTLLKFSEG